ncbi:MAG: DMT family transporter [Alicyclobacillus sp.]|nr:DMT family transporter [Alicyclobacillus sp.]
MNQRGLAYLYLTLTTSGWGSLYVASKFVLARVPVFTLLFLRYFIAGLLLSLLLWQHRRHHRPETAAGDKAIARQDYKQFFLIGCAGYFFATAAQLLGTKLASASVAALVNATNPIFIILFASLILREKLTWLKAVAVVCAITGTCIILGGAGHAQTLGIALSILSVLTWSLVTVLARRLNQRYSPLYVTTLAMWLAAGCSLPVALTDLRQLHPDTLVDPLVATAILFIGVVCTGVTSLLWNKSLALIGAGDCSLFYPLQPLVAALLGWLLLKETITPAFGFGAALVIGGILLGTVGAARRQTAV